MIKIIPKILWFFNLLVMLQITHVNAQSYSLVPVDLNSHASPGDFFYSSLHVVNNSSSPIDMFFTRIVKSLPPNWTSCFCYPTCIAPFRDTLTFTIPAFSEDSIKPNYQSDLVPGIGNIVITLYQVGFASNVDTISFTGSTMSTTGIIESNNQSVSVLPNPANDILFFNGFENNISVKAFNAQGALCISEKMNNGSGYLSVSKLQSGVYLFAVETKSNTIYRKILIQH